MNFPTRITSFFAPAFGLVVGLLLVSHVAAQTSTVLMPITQSWSYSTNNLDGTGWQAKDYVETGWSNLSPALLYIEATALPAPKNTPLPTRPDGLGPMLTYYFRTTFNVTNAPAFTSLTFSNLIDDGAVFYLNGVEVQRVGMAATPITYPTLATRSVDNATTFDLFSLSGDWLTNLVSGTNVLAVEVHQINATTSDIVFGTALMAFLAQPATQLMPITQSWSYSTNNLDGTGWQAKDYVETGWSNLSPALLYIEATALPAPKNTPLPTRPDGLGPMLTYYFRTTFNVTNAPAFTSLTFSNLIDDGAVFYLNGGEVQRVGMPVTPVNYPTLAARAVDNAIAFDLFTLSGAAMTNLVNGTNVLAVEVHQINAISSDIVFGTALMAFSGINTNVNLTRGPYLQIGSQTNTTVRWRTDGGVIGRARYGTNLASLDLLADEAASTNDHEIKLTGLLPDTKYYYSVGTATATLAGSNANHFFVTAPVPGTPKATRIWVLGDAGTKNINQVNVRNAYETFTGARHTDLWLMLGDNAYDTGTDAEFQTAVFNMYTNMLRKSVLWSTLGNHETGQSTAFVDTYPYFKIFTLPKNGEAGGVASGTEHYYSFDYANIHFICLDSMTASRATNGNQFQWLTNDLANTTADWTIAFWHHPPYTKGSHNSDTETELIQMRQVFLPVLEAAGVDLVMSGHSHSYERSYLLDRHYGLSTAMNATNKIDAGSGREGGTGAYKKPEGGLIPHQGTVYVLAGSAGQASGGTLNHPAMYVSLNNLGSFVLDIEGKRLDAKFIRENGTTNDTFTILKQNYAPVASNLSFTISADAATPLALAGSDINRNPISFAPDAPPGNGLISGLNPTSGAFVFTPAHGFSGNGNFTYHVNDGSTNSPLATVNLTVLPLPDANGNGLPDAWEAEYGIYDANADTDGDGLTNLQEYQANTNPTNAASALRVSSASREANGKFTLTWDAIGGTRYRAGYDNAVANGGLSGVFSDITRPVMEEMSPAAIGVVTNQSFTDDFIATGPATNGARYYRVQVVQ